MCLLVVSFREHVFLSSTESRQQRKASSYCDYMFQGLFWGVDVVAFAGAARLVRVLLLCFVYERLRFITSQHDAGDFNRVQYMGAHPPA